MKQRISGFLRACLTPGVVLTLVFWIFLSVVVAVMERYATWAFQLLVTIWTGLTAGCLAALFLAWAHARWHGGDDDGDDDEAPEQDEPIDGERVFRELTRRES